jgi:hypothetical protein
MTLTLVALCFAAPGDPQPTARMGTFDKGSGESYFALGLMPTVALQPAQAREVVILVDTSASQAGVYRDDELAALNTMLSGLNPNDRVKLVAVDTKPVAMSVGFVAPGSAEMQAALAKLQQRVPLGATDMDLALRSTIGDFSAGEATARSVVYLGDGMSKAHVFTPGQFRNIVDELTTAHVSVSSYLIGSAQNLQLMATLANHTGGVVAVDSDAAQSAAMAGSMLASAVQGNVFWPASIKLPKEVAVAYPLTPPPLRSDRDSILIGKLDGPVSGDVKLSGTVNGQPVEMTWDVHSERPSADFAFLPKLVDTASADGGLSLPTAGTPALREAARVMMTSADQLVNLGHEALSSGNFAGAAKVAAAALDRDPMNPTAIALRDAARKQAAGAPVRSGGDADLSLGSAAAPEKGGSLLAEVLAEGAPGFIDDVAKERQVVAGLVEAEVSQGLAEARRVMGENPVEAEQSLKVLLEKVEQVPSLDGGVRASLRDQLTSAIRESRRVGNIVAETQARSEEQRAAGIELERINQELTMKEQRLKQVMDRFNALMDERRYELVSAEVIPEVENLAPNSVIASAVATAGHLQRAVEQNTALRRLRWLGFYDTLYQSELSSIPFPDEPPIVYTSAERWEEITLSRKKYSQVDLAKPGGSEERIFKALNEDATLDFVETPLKDVVTFLSEAHGIPISLNAKKLEEAAVSPDVPVTKNLKGISLRSALRLLLGELELTYVVRDEVLQITTPEDAESQLITKVYPVGDLVVPIGINTNMFGMGGMGGMNGGGGMSGGFGGGMGGMGGGMMGGMGGGMMGGGMGGGMFAVEDELSLGAKKPVVQPEVAVQPEAGAQAEVRRPKTIAPASAKRIDVSGASGWDTYFAGQKGQLQSAADSSAAYRNLMANVRETVRDLMAKKKYGEVTTLLQAALRNGQVESWMFEAMGLAMQADGAAPEDLERALMSAVDFAESDEDVLFIAAYMTHIGLHKRALALCRQVGDLSPSRPEPFLQGLNLAQRLNDIDGIQWACVGIVRQAWPADQKAISENAMRVGKATYEKLLAEKKVGEAKAFDLALRDARARDCVVVVTWTGQADVDLSVGEPSGTICSLQNPRSISGGVLIGDVSSEGKAATASGYSEAYICPEGFSGVYRVLLRNVWGRPTSGKVTIDIYTNYATSKQKVIHKQIDLGEKNAVVLFDVKDGRRKEALPEAQVAQVAKVQNAMNRAVLAQQLAGLGNSNAALNFASSLALANRNGLGFFNRGAVGYRPIITSLPEGANFNSNAVISADRRYVRVAPSPTFSLVTEVNTFNFVTGQGQTQQSGNNNGGGFGGGIGGGNNGT